MRMKRIESELLADRKVQQEGPKTAVDSQIDEFMKNDSAPQNSLEQLDQVIEQLSMKIQSSGFPDSGNLRSTKRKDVKQRIKCIDSMLRQRKKDVDFRGSIQDRLLKHEQDLEALKDKLQRKEAKVS